MPESPAFRLIVGLGNPGREYAETRHNVGFMLLDRLAARERCEWRTEKSWKIDVAKTGGILIAKPLTYINLSGQAVRPLASFYKIEPSQMLIVLDDMALPLGKLRLRADGSSGGQKGLQSIIEHFGTPAIARLRFGIGAAPAGAVGHVLGRFALEEREPLAQSLDRALEAIAVPPDPWPRRRDERLQLTSHLHPRPPIQPLQPLKEIERTRMRMSSATQTNPTKNQMKNRYEGLIVLNIKGNEEGAKEVIERLEGDFKKDGARIESVQKMDRRQFTYVAGPLDSGYYVNFIFAAEPAVIEKLRARFKLDEQVYRQHYQKLATTKAKPARVKTEKVEA